MLYLFDLRGQLSHQGAVEDAQQDAVSVAYRSRVVTPEEVDRLRVDPTEAARELDVPIDEVSSLLGDAESEKDVFVAACKDIENSPYGKPGQTCPSPWNCFDCCNAIIHPRHLPPMLILLDGILESRDQMDEGEWVKVFGVLYSQLTRGLRKFEDGVIQAARQKAQRHRHLDWLPVEMFPRGVS